MTSLPGPVQQLLATLADADRRTLYARLVLEGPLPTNAMVAKDRRRLDALVRAGLASIDADAAHAVDGFSPLLRATPSARGIDRFVKGGRIETWPAKPVDRELVLRWAAEQALQPGERLDERAVTERLAQVSEDPATLRRDLFDGGYLERADDGSAYWR